MIHINRGFTLAETIMTLTIIGIIAVITLPGLNQNIGDNVLEKQKLVFDKNFNQAMHVMQLRGELAKQYDSTADFVNNFSKYLRVTHTCQNNNLDGCFANKIMQDRKKVKYVTKDLKLSTDIDAAFSEASDLVSVVFADGTTALISYDKNCLIADKFSQDVDVTACMSMLYDINGKDSPNILGNDIIALNIGKKTNWDIELVDIGACFDPYQCQTAASDYPDITKCPPLNNTTCCSWSKAMYVCLKRGKRLPTRQELAEIARDLYGGDPVALNSTTAVDGYKDETLKSKLGLNNGDATFWSNDNSDGSYPYARTFSASSTSGVKKARATSNMKAFCINE